MENLAISHPRRGPEPVGNHQLDGAQRSETAMGRWPDFIIMGAMKSATSTLHEQLAAQPGLFMSSPKEPNFFSNDEIYAQGPAWYRALFAGADPSHLCGESSTHYTKLPTYPQTVARMHAAVPDARLIYMMRHPIDRLVSHYLHEQLERRMMIPIDEAVRQFPELVSYGCYSMQLEPFLKCYGPERLLLCFFEGFVKHGQEELERACRFLGYSGQPRWCDEAEATNVSSQRMRASPLRDAIVHAPVLSTIRKRFIPKSWRNRVRQFWQIKERPQLSETSLGQLEQVFDADLARLGSWLGLELTCRNFREVARSAIPQWVPAVERLAQ